MWLARTFRDPGPKLSSSWAGFWRLHRLLQAGASPAPGIWRVLCLGVFSVFPVLMFLFRFPFSFLGFLVLAEISALVSMEEALRLREAVVSAVCSREYFRLAGLVQQLAKLSPTEEILYGSGVGHIVGDHHVWMLAGHMVQRMGCCFAGKVACCVPTKQI